MAHHYDDSDYCSYPDEVILAWLQACLDVSLTTFKDTYHMEQSICAYLNAKVPRDRVCAYRPTIRRAQALRLIVIHNERLVIDPQALFSHLSAA